MPGRSRPSAGTVVVVVGGAVAVTGAVELVVVVGSAAGAVSGDAVVGTVATDPSGAGRAAASPVTPSLQPDSASSAARPAAEEVRPNGAADFSCGPPGLQPSGRAWRGARPRTSTRSRPWTVRPG